MTDTTVQNPRTPDQPGGKTIFGHPRGLVILFLTEMWERFSYYGMRALLIFYLTQHFLFVDKHSTVIYGAYTALVYVMTIIGGTLADRYLGQRKAVTFGAILLVFGHGLMAFEGSGSKQTMIWQDTTYEITSEGRGDNSRFMVISDTGDRSEIKFTKPDPDNEQSQLKRDDLRLEIADPQAVGLPAVIEPGSYTTQVDHEYFYAGIRYVDILYLALALIIAGVGFLKANISTIVGALYGLEDKRRDSGFTIFYMGINLGALLASVTIGIIGVVYGWKWGFGLAGIGMVAGLITFLVFQPWLEGRADPPDPEKLSKPVFGPINVEWACYLTGIGVIAFAMWTVMNAHLVPDWFIGVFGLVMFVGLVGYALIKLHGRERHRMLAAIYFIIGQIPLWALFEQAGSSLNLFTQRLVDREIFGIAVPAPVFQSLNPAYIIIFAPLAAWLWLALEKRRFNPSTPVKFAIGVFLAGLGFLSLVWGMQAPNAAGLTAVGFIFLIYWIHTMGELLISPVGLSAVTRLAPARAVGMTMGAWFLYSGLSNFLAGLIARSTGAETIAGEIVDMEVTRAGYASVYTNVGLVAVVISVVMLLVSPVIKGWMRSTGPESNPS